jgi:hypothetical protein
MLLPPSTGGASRTPDEIAAAAAKAVAVNKQGAVPLALSMFGDSFGSYPLVFSAAGQATAGTKTVDLVIVKSADDFTWTLRLDGVTHLPTTISWMAKPLVFFATSSRTKVTRGGVIQSPPSGTPPPGDPTVGLALVEWRMTISDYRVTGGLNWPHKLTTTIDGKPYEEIRLGTFKINPTIDPKRFMPVK